MKRTLQLLTLALVAALVATLGPPSTPAAAVDTRPNIILITADDMRLDDLEWMPHTRSLLGQLNLTEFVSNHPLCCPARAELLTGQHGHNNGVFHNAGPYGTYSALREKGNTIASWLHGAGYSTGFVGKWLNGWDPADGVARGWSHFNPWSNNVYMPTTWVDWNDGNPVQPGTHTNDGVTNRTVERVNQFSGPDAAPFFLWASYVAPHGMKEDNGDGSWVNPIAAERHKDMPLPQVPPYESKPSFEERHRYQWRARIRSLQSVDEGVRDVVAALTSTGELANTVIVFTSDNGFILGEHGAYGKNLPWEEVLRVPLLARGPGVGTGTSAKGAMMADVAPSLAALAGVTPTRAVDGRSDMFATDAGWINVLIQGGNDNYAKHFKWRGTRTPRWTYVEWIGGRIELYDRDADPFQMDNLAGQRPRTEERLAEQTPDPY